MTPLHHIGDFVRDMFVQVPLPVVRLIFLALPATVLVWVWMLPRETTTRPGGSGRWDENLKLGATLALALQLVIYSLM